MPGPACTEEMAQAAVDAVLAHGSIKRAAEMLGLERSTVQNRLDRAAIMGLTKPRQGKASPSRWRPFDEIVAARKSEFKRTKAAGDGRTVHWVDMVDPGPFMLVALGDPHLDNPGTSLALFEKWADILDAREHRYGLALSDWLDNWLKVLGHLYAEAETTAPEAWILLEGYLEKYGPHILAGCSGNHDDWSGHTDFLGHLMRKHGVVWRQLALRVGLKFPNKRKLTIGLRHRFMGNSQWNPAHAVMKAAQMGWRDNLLVGGDKHISGDGLVRCPDTGKLTWCYQVAAFKLIDGYADKLALMDKHVSPAVAFVIDPARADDDPQLVMPFYDPRAAVDYLAFLRGRG